MADFARPGATGALVGRDREIGLLRDFVTAAGDRGVSLLVSGEPGVGKSALLAMAARLAAAGGADVLSAAGVEFEAVLSYSGLNQLLLPAQSDLRALDTGHRATLEVALGLADGPVPARLAVAAATIALLRQMSARRPVVLVVDDLHWLDRSSASSLGVVARHLTGSRLGFLAAMRPGVETFFDRGALPILDLSPLTAESAAALLVGRDPSLDQRTRSRLLEEAQGNPLALLELPAASSRSPQRIVAPVGSAVPDRLHEVYAPRIRALPTRTRDLLLIAALEASGDLRTILSAGDSADLDELVLGERARLITIDRQTRTVAFSHPLIRTTVVGLSSGAERRDVHRALADVWANELERQAWHLAEAALEPDEDVAARLEHSAHLVLRRGDAVGGVATLLRAADLSPAGADRSRRLGQAAYVGADVTGDLRAVSALLARARHGQPAISDLLETANAAAYLLLNDEGDVDTAHRLLVGAIQAHRPEVEPAADTFVQALFGLLAVCFFGGRPELWEPFDTELERLGAHLPLTLSLCARTFAHPAKAGPADVEDVRSAVQRLDDEADPAQILMIGRAAFYVDQLDGCRRALLRVAEDGRAGGAVTSAIGAWLLLAFDSYGHGAWEDALSFADEGLVLCATHGYRLFAQPGTYCRALVAAARGDQQTSDALCDEMIGWAEPRRALSVIAYARHVRTLDALGRSDFEVAYRQASAVSPAGSLSPHLAHALWLTLDLVDAAVHTERREQAVAHVAAMREAGIAALSPRLALLAGAAEALVAAPDAATAVFEATIARPDADQWPFDLARVHLAYGEHLRRTRAISASRGQFASALEIFELLGAAPWAARASSEMAATGVRHSGGSIASELTPRETEVATLAASGLSNRQIAEQLAVSPRTVGAHLRRVFAKLDLRSRAGLRDRLSGAADRTV